jgi:hypothetical protein
VERQRGGMSFYIMFKYPAFNDGPSDRDFVEVGIGNCGVNRFFIGTEGWAQALEILGAAFPDWQGNVQSAHQGADEDLEKLDRLLLNGKTPSKTRTRSRRRS